MRILIALVGAVVACTLLAPGDARAGQCGMPDASPTWIDYVDGSTPFRGDFAQPGLVVATQGTTIPSELRAAGALTIYWEMKFAQDVGTPAAPADPAGISAAADALYARAAASSGCATPVIALNEFQGATSTPPLSPAETQYRAGVLAFVQELASQGALPYLLMSSAPNRQAGGGYWQQLASVADIVREVYFSAPSIAAEGPIVGSRVLRVTMRQALRALTSYGISAAKLGLMLGFQSGGSAGRDGLQPTSTWLEFVKLDTLAAQEVASELGVTTLWNWGWATLSPSAADPDKGQAACVALWVRNPLLCNAPNLADFDTSLVEGQLSTLPPNAQCVIGTQTITTSQLAQATQLLGSQSAAFTALLARVAATALVPVDRPEVYRAESEMFPNLGVFLAATKQAGVTTGFARGVLTDQLRYAQLTSSALIAQEQQELTQAICRNDVLPALGDVRLASALRFLTAVPQISTLPSPASTTTTAAAPPANTPGSASPGSTAGG